MSVSTELKHEFRFVYYYEHEYYGLLAKCELSKYSYIMIVYGEKRPSKEWCHKIMDGLKNVDKNKCYLAKVKLKGELDNDTQADDVFTVVAVTRTDDGECIAFQQINSSEDKHDLVIDMHTYDIETGKEQYYEYEEKEKPGFFDKLLNFITR